MSRRSGSRRGRAGHLTRLGEHRLGLRSGEPGCRDEPEELALEPAVTTSGHLPTVEHVEEGRDAVAPASAQLPDAPVQQVLARQAIAQRTVDRSGEALRRLVPG